MSELINAKKQHENFRRNLLANVSMLALLGYFGVSQGAALAADDDSPILWIELGGQFQRASDAGEILAPPFITGEKLPAVDIKPLIAGQAPAPFSIGGEGKITFTPRDTNWVLSVSVNYGRADAARHLHQQTAPPYVDLYFIKQKINQVYQQFGDAQTDFKESHAILDFKAGRDFGLGMFGAGGTSVISGGVRFAQFISSADASLHGRHYQQGAIHSGHETSTVGSRVYVSGYRSANFFRHTFAATSNAKRSAHAVGPSLSWDASLPVAKGGSDMVLTADWGIAGAVLFGRQRARTHHQTSGQYSAIVGHREKYPYAKKLHSSYALPSVNHIRSRTVTIPNIGGFAAASYRIADFKVSLGYKADFFFGAMDGGIDAAKKENVGFYGPFASVSIGFGG